MADDDDLREWALRFANDPDLRSPKATLAIVDALVYVGDQIARLAEGATGYGVAPTPRTSTGRVALAARLLHEVAESPHVEDFGNVIHEWLRLKEGDADERAGE